MTQLSQMAAATLERDIAEPAMEYEGRWYTWGEIFQGLTGPTK